MKNLLNKATQSISEVIIGPKIKDIELEVKFEEMKTLEKNIQNLRSFFPKMVNIAHTNGKFFKEFSEAVRLVYGKDYICSKLGNEIADIHLKFEEDLEEFSNKINELNKSTSDWSNIFENANDSMKEREELRKKLERYIDKIAKLTKSKIEKEKKNNFETIDKEKFIRTNDKMNKTSELFINKSFQTYQKVNYFIDNNFNIINSSLSKIISCEIKLFEILYKKTIIYESLDAAFNNSMNSFYRPINKYDPSTYLKDFGLNKSFDINSERQKKTDENFSRNIEKATSNEEEKKGIFSSIGNFFLKKDKPNPTNNVIKGAVEPISNQQQDQINKCTNIQSNTNSLTNNNKDKNYQNDNIKNSQSNNSNSIINNMLNIGPGADPNKDIKITHNNEEINISQSINTLNAGISFYNQHKESIDQMTKIANKLKPSEGTNSSFKSVLETAGSLLGTFNNKK